MRHAFGASFSPHIFSAYDIYFMKKNISINNRSYPVDYPDKCPICHHHGDIITVNAVSVQKESGVEVVFRCPFQECQRVFIGSYGQPTSPDLLSLQPSVPDTTLFPQLVRTISPTFIEVYGQAEQAEHLGLKHIAGPGFRKAFEFLIKDYAKSATDTPRHEAIEKAFSGKVVDEFIGDPRIQAVAKRALWLGNDETHYLRRWGGKDLEDLRTLIRLSVNWIEIERLSASYTEEMPESE